MATSLVGPVWKLDSSDIGALPRTILGAQKRSAWDQGGPTATVTQQMNIGQVTWHATDSAQDDLVIMTDLAGNEMIRLGPATGADFEDMRKSTETIKANGLIVTSLPHGVVLVEIR
jgi:hypothetical protein